VTLNTISGVFSRYFFAGFFLPALFAVAAARLTFAGGGLAGSRTSAELALEVGLIAAVAVPIGLFLLGLKRPLIRFFEGYPLERAARLKWGARLPRLLQVSMLPYLLWARLDHRQNRRYRTLKACSEHAEDRAKREQAKRTFDASFARGRQVLPTRFGNVVRAFEYHANLRWGLDGLTVWPRIAPLLSDRERDLHVDAETEMMFFLNSCAAAAVLACALFVEGMTEGVIALQTLWCGIAVGLAFGSYVLAIDAAVGWGTEVRASIDLRRLELYERLGVRTPTSFSDERAVAARLSDFLAHRHGDAPLPDDLWRSDDASEDQDRLAWL